MSAHKAHEKFVHYQKEMKPEKAPEELKRLSDTRWACRYQAIRVVKNTLPSILATPEEITAGNDRNNAVEAQGLLLQIHKLPFLLCLVVFGKIFGITNKLSEILQCPQIDLAAAAELVTAQVTTLEEYRSEEEWDKIWTEAEGIAAAHNVEVEATRPQRAICPLQDSRMVSFPQLLAHITFVTQDLNITPNSALLSCS